VQALTYSLDINDRYKDARKDHLPYLWAVIMEVTRMYPAVPGGLPRVTPKGGEIIAGKFIPGGVSKVNESIGASAHY
jgi:hypothetical protein